MSELNFLDTGGNKQKITTPAVNSMAFNTANTERVRIDSNGNVSIHSAAYSGGGAAPQLYVVGTGGRQVKIHNPNAGTCSLQLSNATTGEGEDAGFQLAQLSGGNFHFEHQLQAKDIVFRTKPSGGSVTERLRISHYGLVTAPFQYHLHADRLGTLTGYNAGGSFGTPMVFNRVVSETKDSSLSSCFNTSNGLFTAPVTGVYLFNAAVYGGSGNIFGQSWFTLNGSRCTATDWVINGGYSFIQNFQQIRLAAGNTVGFKPYASGQSNVTIYENNNHTYFKVSLIG